MRVASKLTKLASVRAELHLRKEEAGRWQNLNASRCQFFRRHAGRPPASPRKGGLSVMIYQQPPLSVTQSRWDFFAGA